MWGARLDGMSDAAVSGVRADAIAQGVALLQSLQRSGISVSDALHSLLPLGLQPMEVRIVQAIAGESGRGHGHTVGLGAWAPGQPARTSQVSLLRSIAGYALLGALLGYTWKAADGSTRLRNWLQGHNPDHAQQIEEGGLAQEGGDTAADAVHSTDEAAGDDRPRPRASHDAPGARRSSRFSSIFSAPGRRRTFGRWSIFPTADVAAQDEEMQRMEQEFEEQRTLLQQALGRLQALEQQSKEGMQELRSLVVNMNASLHTSFSALTSDVGAQLQSMNTSMQALAADQTHASYQTSFASGAPTCTPPRILSPQSPLFGTPCIPPSSAAATAHSAVRAMPTLTESPLAPAADKVAASPHPLEAIVEECCASALGSTATLEQAESFSRFKRALHGVAQQNAAPVVQRFCSTLGMALQHIVDQPLALRYRKLPLQNQVFKLALLRYDACGVV
ncbi:MAG: hypothetical protein EOO41_03860, partial [Methanobacteriota archaeon]